MDEHEFQRGVSEAEVDIASKECRLFFQTRGSWGELFTKLMRDRFGVCVVHISDITSDSQRSYEDGYNGTVKAYLERAFGAGTFDRTWEEVQQYREENYRKLFGSQDRPSNSG